MKVKITLVAALLLLTASITLYYANKVFFPTRFKKIVIAQAEKILQRQVTIGSIHFHPLSGFTVEELTIFEKDSKETPFLKLKKATFNVLFLSVFKEKKIAIPSLAIETPDLHIVRQGNKNFNFSDLLTKDQTSDQAKGSLSVVIRKLSLTNGKVKYLDETIQPNFSKTIEDIQITANISLLKSADFSIEAQIPEDGVSAFISAKGDYQLASQTLNATVDLRELALMAYLPYYDTPPAIQIKDGTIKEAHFIISLQNKKIAVKSEITTSQLVAKFPERMEFSGSPKVVLDLTYDTNRPHPLEYKGSLEAHQSTMAGLPYIKTAENISGKIYFETDKILSDGLSFSAFDTEIKLAGQLLDFRDPSLDVQASGNVPLKLFKEIIPDIVEKIKVDVQGQAQLAVSFKGKIKAPFEADIGLTAQLHDVRIDSERLPAPLTGINGNVRYQKDKIAWQDLSLTFWKRRYLLDGEILNFARPNLGISVHSQDVQLQLQAIAILNGVKVKVLKGKFLDSAFDLAGTLRLPKDREPVFDVSGSLALQLDNLWKTVPFFADKLKKFNPSGVVHLRGSLAGHGLNWQNWQFNLEARSPGILATDLQLRDIVLVYAESLKIESLKGQYLNSSFDLTGNVQIPENAPPIFDLGGIIDLDLEDLRKIAPEIESKLQDLKPTGRLNIAGTLKGPLADWKDLNINAKAKAPLISLAGYRLNDLAITYNQDNRLLQQCDILATVYDGKFQADSSAKLTAGFPFILTASLVDTNLVKLKKDTALKDKDLAGYLSSRVQMEGNLNDLDTIRGQGSLNIQDGNIWQLNLLRGLGVLLFIPEFSRISFVAAQGDFTIRDQKVSTENFELASEEVGILCDGWVDFAGKLNFDITAQFSQKAIEESNSIKKALTTILSQTNDYLTIKLTGSLKEPKYAIVPLPLDLLQKTGEFLKEGLRDIF